MPGGRRNAVSRTGPTTRSSSGNASSVSANGRSNSGERANTNNTDDKRLEEIYSGRSLAPKHIPIPVVPVDGQLSFEALSLVVSIIAACLQLLNLYRTVWWLPNSYNGYSMNFYLIDPYLLVFIFTMVAHQFLHTLLRQIIDVSLPIQSAPTKLAIRNIISSSLSLAVKSVLVWCLYHMAERHNSMKIFYLCYPSLSIYFVMFGIKTAPFLDMFSCGKEERKTKYILDKPLHNCSLNASAIRAEVSTLRSDFNRRLKRALFSSSGSAYVCVVAPIIFVPPHLHFNVLWVVQHVILFWLGRICAYFAQVYPFRYCDELHRAAMHLGRWIKIENLDNHIQVQPWNDAVLWPHGSIVEHNEEIYRSEGLCTAAEPGNSNHSRFYVLFNNRVTLLSPILALQLLLVNIQLFILLGVTEWYQILSTILLLVIHYYTLFKMARDFLISWKVYRAEQIIQEKSQMVVNPIAQ
ncbi:transmembrane protein 39A isoform X1 [Pogonomyrmex barbatus]|uniref:Transmembrane protein 39A isoform X1 n=1 Tax=Pogonomyrmex barbatus TaxID=144034 RepID=A0A6I9W861_9HYME|nr:transmembrane protein 39A isoform X1 [Pogonomyrmex barbatus]XP_011638309.1 transmembrane protein 39A isoform X1 [Pogonomyrmex barbatus]XP_011638310.1 transmembrane protein 39A isoform X1 [Pogonomyrmex barbatus]